MTTPKTLKIMLLTAVSLVGISVGEVSSSAASWHKGTPKELHGKYQAKRISGAEGFGCTYTITNKSLVMSQSNWPLYKNVKMKYKKLKAHTYLLVGKTVHNSYILAGNYKSVYYLKGKELLHTDYPKYKKNKKTAFKYSEKNPAKKTKHFKDGGPIVHM